MVYELRFYHRMMYKVKRTRHWIKCAMRFVVDVWKNAMNDIGGGGRMATNIACSCDLTAGKHDVPNAYYLKYILIRNEHYRFIHWSVCRHRFYRFLWFVLHLKIVVCVYCMCTRSHNLWMHSPQTIAHADRQKRTYIYHGYYPRSLFLRPAETQNLERTRRPFVLRDIDLYPFMLMCTKTIERLVSCPHTYTHAYANSKISGFENVTLPQTKITLRHRDKTRVWFKKYGLYAPVRNR